MTQTHNKITKTLPKMLMKTENINLKLMQLLIKTSQ